MLSHWLSLAPCRPLNVAWYVPPIQHALVLWHFLIFQKSLENYLNYAFFLAIQPRLYSMAQRPLFSFLSLPFHPKNLYYFLVKPAVLYRLFLSPKYVVSVAKLYIYRFSPSDSLHNKYISHKAQIKWWQLLLTVKQYEELTELALCNKNNNFHI